MFDKHRNEIIVLTLIFTIAERSFVLSCESCFQVKCKGKYRTFGAHNDTHFAEMYVFVVNGNN